MRKENSEDIWIIIRKFEDDAFSSYLIDREGLHDAPVISPMPNRIYGNHTWGYLKISFDKKYLISSYHGDQQMEVCRFNPTHGDIEYLYTLTEHGGLPLPMTGIEFSPDSKYLYVSYNQDDLSNVIYQYDMDLIENEILFYDLRTLVGTGSAFGLQLARDGKIYCSHYPTEYPYYFVIVINKPWIYGEGCMFESNAINMYPGEVGWSFPNILLDYLLRFEWTGEPCQGYPINFKPNFIPTPDSIVWNFGELAPGAISHELSPTYSFKFAGIHEVKVDVWYPGGRFEHTSREIEIKPSPQPDLGNDTSLCEGETLTLTANGSGDFFAWSTGQVGTDEITVTDTGYYWVRARFFSTGCNGYDTIHIAFHPPTIIDETNLQIIPTSCSGASGSISGLIALGSPPFVYSWKDLSEVEFGTVLDVSGLPAGQYYLTITDANGCETVSDVYTIEDAGVNYQYDSVFSGLFAMSYAVQVRDDNGCSGFYLDNPVFLEDIPGPQVTVVNVTDETDFLGDGAIEIVANGSPPTIYYSIDSGATWQINDGNFENLVHSTYYIIIRDLNGCDTAFTVEIQNVILTYLHAVTGEDGICEDSTALIPVNVDNFNNVADFHLKLGYNTDYIECKGFANVNVQLLDSLTGWVDPIAGDIHLAWNSPTSVTFTGTEKVANLVFTTKNPGQGELAWYTGATERYFTNASGTPIPAAFSTGEVTVYEPPEIELVQTKTVCTGQFVFIQSSANGNQQPINYQWIYPNGDTTDNDPLFFSVSSSNSGFYTVLATDRVGCTDQKSIELIVSENPVAAFHGTDTLVVDSGYLLDAGEGMASYRWNTGDSTNPLVIEYEGVYWLEMTSHEGCTGSDSVYVKLIEDEILPPDPTFNIFIPNAFSPDGDGVNDNFNISYNNNINSFPITHFVLHIFDRWGEGIFQTDDIAQGWDGMKNGNPCSGGVYIYKILFEMDGEPGRQERIGVIMLVR